MARFRLRVAMLLPALVLAFLPLVATSGSVGAASQLTVDPYEGAAGTQFTIRATGFTAGVTYNVIVTGPSGKETGRGTVKADAQGVVSANYDSTGDSPGSYKVEVIAGAQFARGSFTVTGGGAQCFAATGKCIQGRFRTYWNANGGLEINGYPISDEFQETLEDGRQYTVQYFERVRLEYHPENPAPYDVLLGQFGRILYQADRAVAPKEGYTYFPQTGHNVGGSFISYWYAKGGLEQFGYPISEEFTMRLEDGNLYVVQYFERARFEYHPENTEPYRVLLGQFGRQILDGR